ncbi:shK domain-like domain-containing protein [Ditylenchus destructor]|uniref:ShK domain-like domain-containing protein n=1 Tax=Ditylenchus destructor TaxID=166010 RepID=A0AAD4R5D4_9BILA|nr:shK domain-like domain-containing protein [Ditylenchus destructor]
MMCISGKRVTVSTLFVLINLIIPCQQQKQPPLVPPKPVIPTATPPTAVVAPGGINCQGACILGQIMCPSARIQCVVPPHCYRLVSNGKELVWQTATGKSVNTLNTAAGGKPIVQPQLKCEDKTANCHVFKNLCREPLYHVFMASRCSKSCGFCGPSTNGTNPEPSTNNGETAVKPVFNLSSPAPLPIRTLKKVEMRRRPTKNGSTTTKSVQTTTQKTTARATETTLTSTTLTQISVEDLNSENATLETVKTEMTEKYEKTSKMTSTTQQSVTEEEIEMAVASSNEATDDNDQNSSRESQNGVAVAENTEIAEVEDTVDEIALLTTTQITTPPSKRKSKRKSPVMKNGVAQCPDSHRYDSTRNRCCGSRPITPGQQPEPGTGTGDGTGQYCTPYLNVNGRPKCPATHRYDPVRDACCGDTPVTRGTTIAGRTTRSPSRRTTPRTGCVDKNVAGRPSDCPANKDKCNDTLWYDLMTEQCPRTCNRCGQTASTNRTGGTPARTGADCADGTKAGGGSDCAANKNLCTEAVWRDFMRRECPLTCGVCTRTTSTRTRTGRARDDTATTAGRRGTRRGGRRSATRRPRRRGNGR